MTAACGGELRIFPDAHGLYRAVAAELVACATQAMNARDRFTVALAGGSTPRPLYELLASPEFSEQLDWTRTEVFFGDERCVPPDDVRSNFRMAADALLAHVPLPADRIHRIHGEENPAFAALHYVQELQAAFRCVDAPRFDLILLGMGENGHTASLFPGGAALRESVRLVVPQYVESQQEWRITLTLPLLNAAAAVWVLIQGAAKTGVLQRVLEGPFLPEVLPVQGLAPAHGQLVWWLDRAAAAALKHTPG